MAGEGGVGDAICRKAKALGASTLVLASHKLGRLSEFFLGSVSNYCVHHSEVSGKGGGDSKGTSLSLPSLSLLLGCGRLAPRLTRHTAASLLDLRPLWWCCTPPRTSARTPRPRCQ